LLVGLVSGAAAHAAPASPGLPSPRPVPASGLQLRVAEQELRQHNPVVLRAREISKSLAHQAVAVAQLPDPRLGVMAQNVPLNSGSLAQGQNAMLSVGLSQHFPPFGQRAAEGAKGRHQARAALYGALETRAQALLALRRAWADALYGQHALMVLRQQQELYADSARVARARFRAGGVPESDFLRARLEQQALTNRQYQAQALVTAARATIAALLVRPALPVLSVAWPHLPSPPSLAMLQARLAGTPLLRRAEARRAAAEDGVAVAHSAYYPSVTLSGSYGKTYYPGMPDQASLGVTVSLPLFATNRQDQRLDAARAAAAAARDAYVDTAARLQARVRSEFARYLALKEESQQTRRVLLPTARQAFHAALASYAGGQARMTTVLKAERAELKLALAVIGLRRDLMTAVANLDYLATDVEQTR
ncbi:MAG TPA: TolC family protein, partial [Acidiferrobacteraceae bacterium]|nr:TolC family protein [Acidiferrobacteraceae bacterium]